jgi:hypothetical protein
VVVTQASGRVLQCGSESARQEGERVAGVVAIERAERAGEGDGVGAAQTTREAHEQRE